MSRGRPPLGPHLVDRMAGSEVARQRLGVILQTIAGRLTVAEACRQFGIGEAAFHKLRSRVIQSALENLEPALPGRPRQKMEENPKVAKLRQEVTQLRIDLRASQIREETALVMPHLLKDRRERVKKTRKKLLASLTEPDNADPPSSDGKRGWWRGWWRGWRLRGKP